MTFVYYIRASFLIACCLAMRKGLCSCDSSASLTNTITGQVINVIPTPPHAACILDCDTHGVTVYGYTELLSSLRHGDRITGTYTKHTNGHVSLRTILSREHGELPEPRTCSVTELARRLYQPAAIHGVVQSANRDETNLEWNWMTLQTPEGTIPVSAQENDFPLRQLVGLIDAEVTFKGYPAAMTTWRTGLGPCFILLNDYEQEIQTPPPLQIADIPEYNGRALAHRQRLSATIVAMTQQRLFAQGPGNIMCEISRQGLSDALRPGDTFNIAGFVEIRPDRIVMMDCRADEPSSRTPPTKAVRDISLGELFPDPSGWSTANEAILHQIVRVEEPVIGRTERPTGQRVIFIGSNERMIEVDLSGLSQSIYSDIQLGSRVRVTGLCLADVDYNPARFRIRSFSVLPRSPEDIFVVSYPSWWTVKRLLALILILTVFLICILGWNRALHVLSERRGRALFREQIARVGTELRISERTRLAMELHDSLSQNLAGVAFQITAAKHKQNTDPTAATTHLETAERMLQSSRTEFRRCLWDLREETLEESNFADAIAKSVDPVSADASVDIRFTVPRERLTDMTAHAILCIIRELVTNAVTHGNASHIRIAGELHANALSFSVTDNGIGFDPQNHPGVDSGHFGLDGIRERIKRLRGDFTVESQIGKGARAVVRIPVTHATAFGETLS